ncbi:probable spindle pole body component 97 [Phialocephala subalpina]|uniref:Spindle pole body component n=1 Tax=Phialocephala subalpina TaxID=576137 RepID=A0A1L7XBU2_9HELO|nr:probable spindle pole body component 97 [Phialocephala subalpina]
MSSLSNARVSSRTERRTATDNGNTQPRAPSAQQERGNRSERPDPRQTQSPQPPASGTTHRRTASGTQRTNRNVEERRTERVQVTTRETVTSRTRSPERPRPSAQQTERTRPPEPSRTYSENSRPRSSKAEAPSLPWNPEVSLVPHTSAPLASRITIPPLASQAPQSLQPRPLHELSLEVQEAAILEDLLMVFMGYEGQYVRFTKGYNPSVEKDRLEGPGFKILPGLDPSLQDLTTTMLKMATHYGAVEAFVEVQSREEFGAVNHALCAAIRKLLQDYLILIAQLETQFLTNPSFTLHVLNLHTLPTSHMMFQLYSLAREILKRNSLLEDEDSDDGLDDIENILESLREGGDLGPGNIPGKKICKGGSVLGLITKRLETMSGDPAARSLLTSLLRDASRPYMMMLNEWLHHGSIKDPHAEFLVREQKSIRRERLEEDYTDEYWERRYTIRDHDVPPQLEGVKDKVLLAGKYLNVVRECGGVDVSKAVTDVPRSFDDNRFLDNVNSAYAHANQSLLELLLTTHALPARLRSLKHYFFLDRSDFFSYFLELGTSELRKPVKNVNTSKLQSLLDLVLRQPGSVAAQDPFKEDIKVEMNEISLTNSLTRVVNISGIEQGETLQTPASQPTNESDKAAVGFTSLQLDYSVPFPVSLVISRKTVWRYQALFRYLLSLRYLEQQLVSCWQTHNRSASWSHKSSNKDVERWKRRVFTLRARMLVFVQQLLYFCTAEVIEPNWQALMARLKTKEDSKDGTTPVRTVDELMQDHVDFLDTCLKECMLTNSRLLRIHSKLMQTCTFFATYTGWLSRELERADSDLSGTEKPGQMSKQQWERYQADRNQRHGDSAASNASATAPTEEARLEKLFEIIKKYEVNFSRHLQILLDALNHYAATETVVLLGLCARLSTANQGTQYSGLRADEDGASHG